MTSSDLYARRYSDCEQCKKPVIRARDDKGKDVVVDAEPVIGGRYALHDFGGGRPLATVPAAKLSFGRRLYVLHKGCAAASSRRRRTVA